MRHCEKRRAGGICEIRIREISEIAGDHDVADEVCVKNLEPSIVGILGVERHSEQPSFPAF